MDIKFCSYQDHHFDELHNAFIDAFSSYFVSFSPDKETFHERIYSKLNIANELSGVVMGNARVVSFILHALNTYQGKKTVYNGGTGTRINHRGSRLGFQLYEFLFGRIKESGAERILLEVIDKNKKALNLYESLGFQFTRVLKCYKLKQEITSDQAISIRTADSWLPELSANISFEPCFMDSTEQLKHNLKNETILIAEKNNQTVGHLIFQPKLGRISQLAIHPNHRSQGIGRSLLAECQRLSANSDLTLLNIPEAEIETIGALETLGFANEIDQFELELVI